VTILPIFLRRTIARGRGQIEIPVSKESALSCSGRVRPTKMDGKPWQDLTPGESSSEEV
jgi:hypothetical protein